MQQMKSGPRKHPGGWWQFIFNRWQGLAAGDDDLPLEHLSLRVKVRRATLEDALTVSIEAMLDVSANLVPSDEYITRLAEFRRWNPPYIWTSSGSG
jgi:hypothetical protein